MLLWTKRIIGWLSFLALIGYIVTAARWGYLTEAGGVIDDIQLEHAPWRSELPQPDPAEIADYVAQSGLDEGLGPKLEAYVLTEVPPKAHAAGDSRGPVKKYRNALAVVVFDPQGTIVASYPDYFTGERFDYPLGFPIMASDQPLFYPGEYVNLYTRHKADLTIDVDGLVITIPDTAEGEIVETEEELTETEAQWERQSWARDVRTRIDDYIPYSDTAMTQMLTGPDGEPGAILFTALHRDLKLRGVFWQGLWEEFGPGYKAFLWMISSVIAYWLLLSVWAGLDARWRGMSPWVWTIVLFIANFIGLLVYLLVRVRDPRACPQCKKRVHDRFSVCPYCGLEMLSRCPACRAYIQPGWRFCPGCKLDLWSDEAKAKVESRARPPAPPVQRAPEPPKPVEAAPVVAPAQPEQVKPERAAINVRAVDDETGSALGGVRLTFTGPSHLTATTDSSGIGRAYGAEFGEYEIAAEKAGYARAERKTDVQAGEARELVLSLKAQAGTLSGRVLDGETKEPLSGARVAIDSVRVDQEAQTTADGSFKFDAIPPGPYVVFAQKEGYMLDRQSGQVRPGEETQLDFALRRDPAAGPAGEPGAQETPGGEGDEDD